MGHAPFSLFHCFIICCLLLAIVINIGNYISIKSQYEYTLQQKLSFLQLASKNSLQDTVEKRHSLTYSNLTKVSKDRHDKEELPRCNQGPWTLIAFHGPRTDLEVQSHRRYVYVSINGTKIYDVNEVNERSRGMHVIVLHQQTCALMASEVFDFYGGDNDFIRFLNSIHRSRITIFFIKDDASNGFTKVGRSAIESFGCRLVHDIAFRDSWVCITKPRIGLVVEGIVKKPTFYHGSVWTNAARIRASVKLEKSVDDEDQCKYGDNEEEYIRKSFCDKYEGYWDVCNCSIQLIKEPPKLINNTLAHAPVVIIASNRPRYLFRMLYKLLSVPGADRKMMTVFIDGYYSETRAVAELFGLKVVINEIACKRICRIQQHYKKSLSRIFDDFPRADVAIILEEDLEVSDDIIDYFSQTYPLFKKDSSIYCISAWNDQGYLHSVKDPSLLYRVETMPGLGWLLSRSLYKNELESKWPGNRVYSHWDIWMRRNENRKGRECIIPDISRTYHFGANGLNINKYYQKKLFDPRALNKESHQIFDIEKMMKNNYEKELQRLISDAEILNYTRTSCKNADDIIPNTRDKIYMIFIKMEKNNTESSWLGLAKCFKLWESEMRDFHNGLIRFWIKENHIIVIGSPESKYAHYKPEEIIPIEFKKEMRVIIRA